MPEDDRRETNPLLVSAPVLLRSLASYLEVTGQSQKFSEHLAAVLRETEAGQAGNFDGGGRGPVIG